MISMMKWYLKNMKKKNGIIYCKVIIDVFKFIPNLFLVYVEDVMNKT